MNRAVRPLAVAAASMVLLTGCVRSTVETTFTDGGTFSQHSVIAFDLDAVESFAGSQDLPLDGLEGSDGLGGLLDGVDSSEALQDLEARYPGQITVEDFAEGDLTGVEITATDLPVDEFNEAAELASGIGASASVQLTEDQYVVTMTPPEGLDLRAAGVTDANLRLIESSVDVAVTYTFPGLVESATAGEVDGRSVELGLADLASGREIVVVAGASDQIDWGPFLRWGGFALATILVVGGAAALVVQDRRARHRNSLPPPTATDTPSGPGVLGGEDTPGDPTDTPTEPRA
ncbi:LppM family (lipo)protein [uncultured Demequina sp.]|uniref:LppM family (lipo)protein n=1 Tax=uncultured Demequina sp. TaxID=693499 RepID=UPI0025F0A4A7|nr:hypothetical protein [uncultured Demequina sp.]